jgi:ABC-type branched-subunit amino acid transport system permease subunit
VVGGLLSLPLRRLSGVWVAIATLAFAFFFDAVMVKFAWIGGAAAASTDVPRPVIGPWDFGDDRAFLVLVTVVLAIAAAAVVQLRSGTIGQQLRALRGSEVAAQSIGISPARARAIAFALAAFIAGLGGALLAMHQENVNYATNFTPFATLLWLVVVVTMGSTAVSGAMAGAASFALADAVLLKGELLGWILRGPDHVPGIFPVSSEWLLVGFGLATIQFARHPEGAIEMARRRSALRKAVP